MVLCDIKIVLKGKRLNRDLGNFGEFFVSELFSCC